MGDRGNSNILPDDTPPLKRSRNTICCRLFGKNLETVSDGVSNCSTNDSQIQYDSPSSVIGTDTLDMVTESITDYVKCILHPIFSKFAEMSKESIQSPAADGQCEFFNCGCRCHQEVVNKGLTPSSQKEWSSRFDAMLFQQVNRYGVHATHDNFSESVSDSPAFNYPTPSFAQIPGPISTSFQTPPKDGQDCIPKQAIRNRSADENNLDAVVDNLESNNRIPVTNASEEVEADNRGSSITTLTGVLNASINRQGYVKLACASCRRSYHAVTSVGSRFMFTKCGHMLCRPCIRKLIRRRDPCPICHSRLSYRKIYKLLL